MPTELNFEQIVRDHQSMVFRTLARLTGGSSCGPAGALDDLAQDVFLRLYRALPNFRGEAQIATYLYRITVNVAQDEWKRRRREDRAQVSLSAPLGEEDATWEDRLAHPGPTPAEQIEASEFALAVEEQLARLSHVERSILVLYHQEERSYEQIAHILAMPIGTVRTHLHRGRKKMRAALSQLRSQPQPQIHGVLHAR